MTSKQQAILAIGGVAAFVLVQRKKQTSALTAKATGRGIPTAPGTGSTPKASKPNTTNLATRNGTALTPQAPSTIARVLSGVSMGLHDLSKLFHRTGEPTNARPGGTSAGSGAPSSSSGSSSSSGNVPGIPSDATPEYDTYGNLIGYDDGTTGGFVDLRTPAYDNAGNEIGYYDAAGSFVGESVLFDSTTPTTTDLPSTGSANTDTSAPTPGINADGSPSNDGPAIEQVNDDPTQSWFNPPAPDTSAVSVDSAADTAVTDRNVYDDAWFAAQPDVFVGNDLTPNDPGYWEPNFAGNPYDESADDTFVA